MSQLDDRARSAVAALRAQADAAPDHPPVLAPRHPRVALVAAAVAVVVVVAAFVVVLRDGRDDHRVASGADAVPRLISPNPPPGWAATGAADLPFGTGDGQVDFALYAHSDDDTFAGPSVAVAAIRRNDSQSIGSGDEVDINGHKGFVDEPEAGTVTVYWLLATGEAVQVRTHGISRDAALDAARSVTVDETGGRLVSPPDGMTLVAQLRGIDNGGGLSAFLGTGSVGHVVGYQSADGNGSAEVGVVSGDANVLTIERYFLAPGSSATRVRGHTGWVHDDATGQRGTSYLWQEAPNVIGVAVINGLDAASASTFVEGLRPASDEEWAALRAKTSSDSDTSSSFSSVASASSVASLPAAPLPPPAPPDATASLTGAFEGASYVVYVPASGGLGFDVTVDGRSSSVAGGGQPPPADDAVIIDLPAVRDGAGVVYGRVPSNVVRVRVVAASGDEAEGPVHPVDGGAFSLFAFGIHGVHATGLTGATRADVTLLEAAGNEVDHVSVLVTPV